MFVIWTPQVGLRARTRARASSLGQAVIEQIRAVRRETFRDAVFLWTIPFCAERIRTGSTTFIAVSAAALLPDAIASSTPRTVDFMRERRLLLVSVRRIATRAARFAEDVLAISASFSGTRLQPLRSAIAGTCVG